MKLTEINENGIMIKIPLVKSIQISETSVTVKKTLIKKVFLLIIAIAGILITRNIYGIQYGEDLLWAKGHIINFGIAVLGAVTSYSVSEFIGSFVDLGKAKIFIYSAFSFLYGLWFFDKAVFTMRPYYDIFDAEGNCLLTETWFWLTVSHTVLVLLIFALTMLISHIVKIRKNKKINKDIRENRTESPVSAEP